MRFLITFAFSLAVTLASLAQTKDYVLNIGEFTEFTVANSINVVYRNVPDSTGLATFSCSPEIAPSITIRNKDSKLKIELINETPISELPTLTIYSLALSQVTNWGDSTIRIERINPGVEFKAKVIGNGDIEALNVMCTKAKAVVDAGNGHIYLTGKCQEAKYSIKGAGSIEAGNMEAVKVKCNLVGIGSIDCYATDVLNISGFGSGSVYYRGTPNTLSHKGLGIKIHQVELEK